MPISRWRRLPSSGAEVPSSGIEIRQEIIRAGQQSPRGGIVDQFGNINCAAVDLSSYISQKSKM